MNAHSSLFPFRETASASDFVTLQDGPSAQTRHLLARLDVAITELESEQRRALAVEREVKEHATEIGRIKAELMSVRDGLRPVLDPSAPREYPYDKR